MKLYHYVHCPFCVRIRMVLSYLEVDYTSIVLDYNDEKTPIGLSGKKMLPIMEINGEIFNESLEIIRKLDVDDKLNTIQTVKNYNEIEVLLNKLGSDVHSLAMPYWIWTPEFNSESRAYFQTKKEVKRGPFKDLVKRRYELMSSLEEKIQNNKEFFLKDLNKDKLDLKDILIASHLWGMYIVPEFQFSPEIHTFLKNVAKLSQFNYHKDFWV